MKVSTTGSNARIVRQFVITEDNPVVGMAYASQPKKVIVDRGVIEYTWQDGRWVVKNEYAVDVVGDVLKKDGARSKNVHSRHPNSVINSYLHPELRLADDFLWLQPIIDLLRPNGDLSMMILNEHRVWA